MENWIEIPLVRFSLLSKSPWVTSVINDSNLASSSNIIKEHSLKEQKSLYVEMIGQEQQLLHEPAEYYEMKGQRH